ncbi:hypothetical protein [Dolichospermum compactum]|uniref:Filamentous hemagglutinin outer membrane protein n=1 Tax=Dolichospermum compactum NIES-806 TaxID=1973481 RepID=A0A1Z4UZ77_9CYAN|nr:hypothetical protein [Dolichospermum compactum]BAZ84556.1 hypothetical protein NIES806_07460 [Dolichospermum compactum NIES-806]
MATRNVIADGNYSDSTIWFEGILPGAGDDVVINLSDSDITVTLTNNTTIKSLSQFETFQWNSGTINVSDGFTNNGNLSIGYGDKYITGVLQNKGVVTQSDYYSPWWTYYGNIYLNNSSQIINQIGATYDLQGGNIRPNFPADYQGAEAKFDNKGTFTKTSGYSASIYVDFDNSSTVNINAGNLGLTNDFINTGIVNVNAGTLAVTGKTTNSNKINVEGGSLSLTGGGTNTNGTIYVDIDAALTLEGIFNFGVGSQITGRGGVTLNSGQLNFNLNQTSIRQQLHHHTPTRYHQC